MNKKEELEKIIQGALKSGTVGVLSFEGQLCPVLILSVTREHIRVSRTNLPEGLFSGMEVSLELCSNRGCLVLQTEIIEVPDSKDEGILLAIPEMSANIFLRQFWRLAVHIPAEIKPHAHPRRIKAIIRNISAGGMLISIDESLEVGESVDIFFSLKDSISGRGISLHLVGSVTHVVLTDKGNQISLKFVGMLPEDEKRINEFVIRTLRTACPQLSV